MRLMRTRPKQRLLIAQARLKAAVKVSPQIAATTFASIIVVIVAVIY